MNNRDYLIFDLYSMTSDRSNEKINQISKHIEVHSHSACLVLLYIGFSLISGNCCEDGNRDAGPDRPDLAPLDLLIGSLKAP